MCYVVSEFLMMFCCLVLVMDVECVVRIDGFLNCSFVFDEF